MSTRDDYTPATVDDLASALRESQQQLAECTRRLQMLYQVTAQLNLETDLAGVMGVTLESLWQAMKVDLVAVILGEDELGPFHVSGIRGVEDPVGMLGQECPVPLWGVLAQALVHHPAKGEADYLVIHDIEAEKRPLPNEFPWPMTQGSLMIVPMRQAGKTLGAFLIGSRQLRYFMADPVCHYICAITGAASCAIQEAQARQQSSRWIKQLISLQSLTRTITRTRRLDSILTVLDTELHDLFGDVDIRIFLNRPAASGKHGVEPVSQTPPLLWLYASTPMPNTEKEQLTSSALLELVHWVMQAEQPIFFEPTLHPANMTDFYYRSSGRGLMVPIGEEKPEGVIYLNGPRRNAPFEESDLIVVRTIGNSIAIALGNIDLYTQLHRMRSPLDPSIVHPGRIQADWDL